MNKRFKSLRVFSVNQSRGSTCRSLLLKDHQVVERFLWSVVKGDRKIQVKFRCNALMFVLQSTGDLPVTIFFSTVHVYFLAMYRVQSFLMYELYII